MPHILIILQLLLSWNLKKKGSLNIRGSLGIWTDGNNISNHNCQPDLFPMQLATCHVHSWSCYRWLSQCVTHVWQQTKLGSTMARLLSGARTKAPCKSVTKVLTGWEAYKDELLKSRHLLLKRKGGWWWWWTWRWWMKRKEKTCLSKQAWKNPQVKWATQKMNNCGTKHRILWLKKCNPMYIKYIVPCGKIYSL